MTSLLDDIRTGLYAFLDNSNVIVTALTALVILATRSAGILYFAVGAVVCSRTVKFVKRFIRQPRPLNPLPDRQKESYGMPSTHSAVIAYYGAYTVLAALYLPLHHSLQSIPAVRALALVIVVPWATAIAVSRTWLGHHTWLQVGAGCLHGLAFTYMWFSIWVGGVNERGWELEQRYLARV